MPKRSLAPKPQLPAVPLEHQPKLGALMMFPTLPPDHMTFLVEDDAFHPHLRRGEFAVVDVSDRQPAQGELFLISYASRHTDCGLIFAICQMRSRPYYFRPGHGWRAPSLAYEEGYELAPCWSACHWIPPTYPDDYAAALRSGQVGTSEGPYTTEHAAEKLVGRIVGVRVPAKAR